jgi:hypothetical protein
MLIKNVVRPVSIYRFNASAASRTYAGRADPNWSAISSTLDGNRDGNLAAEARAPRPQVIADASVDRMCRDK